ALHFLSGYRAYKTTGKAGPECADFLRMNPSLAILSEYGFRGAPITLSNACVSSADAIGAALDLLEDESLDAVLCGGADTLNSIPHAGFARLMIYSDEPCRPFDKNRKGLNLGEAAAFLVLERHEKAIAAKKTILGEIYGYGSHCDAHHFTSPHPEGLGLSMAIRDAFDRAGITSEDLAFVNAHGTGTRENDRTEGQVLRTLCPGVPVWCTKGQTGHTLGAAGALECAFSLWALNKKTLPPSIGFSEPDPEIGIGPITKTRRLDKRWALSTSLGFGGGNSALILAGGGHG
ncbi:MAG: beta-ketoacyl-[acyl-carrier-protein] synthase family protein, partial [Mailhella sp.]|nr:beta-ketoacyl-[acyl-carrier-protein] synthase family protein [Mailhella sp.]